MHVLSKTILLLAAAIAPVVPAAAQSVVLDAVDWGQYHWDGEHEPANVSYLVGNISGAYNEYRAFFVFDLSTVTERVVAATLELYNPGLPSDIGDGYQSPDASETFATFDVTARISTLVEGGTGLTSVFDDLGGGLEYGSVEVSAADNATIVRVTLSQEALIALNQADGQWAIGGALTTLAGSGYEMMFSYSHLATVRRLALFFAHDIFNNGFEDGNSGAWSSHIP